jgi:hypothetical protein
MRAATSQAPGACHAVGAVNARDGHLGPAPAGCGACESTTVAGAEAMDSPVTMIYPIMYGCGVQA